MKNMNRISKKEAGFSMVELLVAIALGSIVIALIVAAYWSQTQTSKTQKMMVEIQQNIRAAIFFMQQDIMMAGYSDDPANPAAGTITTADPTGIQFTYADPYLNEDGIDNNGDGQTDEMFEKDGIDNNGDGDTDEINELETIHYVLVGNELHRELIAASDGSVRADEIIAYNIQNIEFLYILENGSSATTYANQTDMDSIRKVGISILAETEYDTTGPVDTQSYTSLSGAVWGPYNDHKRRELVTTTVLCRNMLR